MSDLDPIILERYRKGLDFIADRGLLWPTGDFILLEAIMERHTTTLHVAGAVDDPRKAVAFVIKAVGPDIDENAYPVGHHCHNVSASATPLNMGDSGASGRYVICRAKDIDCVWDYEALL